MFDQVSNLGYGIVVFAVIVVVGTVVIYNLGGSVGCSTTYPAYNSTANKCQNSTGSQVDPTGTAYTNANYLGGQLGQSGIAGWAPAIIAVSVGLLFLGAFAFGKGRRK